MLKVSGKHVVLVDNALTVLFCMVSMLVIGYWRAITVRYGLDFVVTPMWWAKFFVAMIAVVPVIFGDQAWDWLRTTMARRSESYRVFCEPFIPRGAAVPRNAEAWWRSLRDVVMLAIVAWVIVCAPLSDRVALFCYLTCVAFALAVAFFAGIMALVECVAVRKGTRS